VVERVPGGMNISYTPVFRWDTYYGIHGGPWTVTEMPDASQWGGDVLVDFLSGTTNGKLFLKTSETSYIGWDNLGGTEIFNPVQERTDGGGVWGAQGVRIATFPPTSSYSDMTGIGFTDELAVADPNTFFFHLSYQPYNGGLDFNHPDTILEYSNGQYYTYQIQATAPGGRTVTPWVTTRYSGVLASKLV
jgi:hypothetical protein